MKFAFVSHIVPPAISGQTTVQYRLLSGISPERYCLISKSKLMRRVGKHNDSILPVNNYYLKPDPQIFRLFRWRIRRFQGIVRLIETLLLIIPYALQIANAVRKESCSLIIACSGDPAILPAAWIASRLLSIDFAPYIFDDYINQWADPYLRRFAQSVEPKFMNQAVVAIAPNEFMVEELKKRYRKPAKIIRNPCLLSSYRDTGSKREKVTGDVNIVFTGAVYEAHHDSFRSLIMAINLLKNPNATLNIYTGSTQKDLHRRGIIGPVVIHKHLPPREIPNVQQNADILYLPLAFDSPYPEVIRTSAPGKICEYLSAGIPILVHAPKSSFISWLFTNYECGLVVNENDSLSILEALKLLLTDTDLRKKLANNSRNLASQEFNITINRKRFSDAIGLTTWQIDC